MKYSIIKFLLIIIQISTISCITLTTNDDIQAEYQNINIISANYTERNFVYINREYEKIITKEYQSLMSDYCLKHYGIYNYKLENPKIIVIHATASLRVEPIISTFKPDRLVGREDAKKGGNVNLGSHFLVDRDGTIYSIIPLDTIARHTIGFNYTAIGIENVGYPDNLTFNQLEANVKLIKYLKREFNSIEHIIGHHEFNDIYMPHYKLMKQFDKSYKLGNKIDPGYRFMSELRYSM